MWQAPVFDASVVLVKGISIVSAERLAGCNLRPGYGGRLLADPEPAPAGYYPRSGFPSCCQPRVLGRPTSVGGVERSMHGTVVRVIAVVLGGPYFCSYQVQEIASKRHHSAKIV